MLDQRLIGQRFTNLSVEPKGTVSFFGILYHYHVRGACAVGDTLEVIEVTPSYLIVQKYISGLDY